MECDNLYKRKVELEYFIDHKIHLKHKQDKRYLSHNKSK